VAVDAVFDSVSVATTFREELKKHGVIFCAISEAIREYPELVRQYVGSVVRITTTSSPRSTRPCSPRLVRVHPEGVRCPMELSTYFRINAESTGQFERTLIVADDASHVSYLEGLLGAGARRETSCTPRWWSWCPGPRDHQVLDYPEMVPGRRSGAGRDLQLRDQARRVSRPRLQDLLDPGGDGLGDHVEVPGCILQGDDSIGEFYSVAVTNHRQQADTGTKMIHMGKNTRSTIVSKGISAGRGQNTYRGLVKILKGADHARNYSQCDSMLIGDRCGAPHLPVYRRAQQHGHMEHEASTSKIGEDQILLRKAAWSVRRRRRIDDRQRLPARSLQGAADGVRRRSAALLGISLEGSVG